MQKRSYYLDWVRVISIGLVFLFHCGRFFDHEDWHVKNNTTSELATQAIFFISRWIMPLFFFISGASTSFALKGRTLGGFVKGRLKRLAVPLILGILILSPPQVYLERLTHNQFSGPFIDFLPHYFDGWYAFGGNFAWMGLHLWYLLLLLVFSFAGLPSFHLFMKNPSRVPNARPLLFIAAILVLSVPGTLLSPDGILGSRIWGGWSMVEHFIIFIMGYVLFSSAEFPGLLERWRKPLLTGAIALSFAVMIPNPVSDLSFGDPWYFLKMLVRSAHCLTCVFTVLGFARHYLNSGGPALKHLNEAVLPFYILHQAVIVPVGFWVVATGWSIGLKYLVIVGVSFVIVILLYAPISRIDTLRYLFGMSAQRRTTTRQTGKTVGQLVS